MYTYLEYVSSFKGASAHLGHDSKPMLNRMEEGVGGLEIAVQQHRMHQFQVTFSRHVHYAPPRPVDRHNITRSPRFDHRIHSCPESQRTGRRQRGSWTLRACFTLLPKESEGVGKRLRFTVETSWHVLSLFDEPSDLGSNGCVKKYQTRTIDHL